jgi:hypothetical protein
LKLGGRKVCLHTLIPKEGSISFLRKRNKKLLLFWRGRLSGARVVLPVLVAAGLASCSHRPTAQLATDGAPRVSSQSELPQCLLPHPMELREWLVFFPPHQATLTDRTKRLLDALIDAGRQDIVHATLLGGTDGSETGKRDRTLRARRIEAVRAYLAERAPPRMWTFTADPRPFTLVDTPAGMAEPQNRIVQIQPDGVGSRAQHEMREQCVGWIRAYCIDRPSSINRKLCDQALSTL